MAQEVDIDPYAECAAVLAAPPASQLVQMSEDGTYGKLGNLLRPQVLGKTCSTDQITEYMLNAGWVLRDNGLTIYETKRESYYYIYDSLIAFCLPERGFWRLLSYCGGTANFFWFESKVTWLVIGPPIRFGG